MPVLKKMIERGYGKKGMSRETPLSYDTVKSYLSGMEAEGFTVTKAQL